MNDSRKDNGSVDYAVERLHNWLWKPEVEHDEPIVRSRRWLDEARQRIQSGAYRARNEDNHCLDCLRCGNHRIVSDDHGHFDVACPDCTRAIYHDRNAEAGRIAAAALAEDKRLRREIKATDIARLIHLSDVVERIAALTNSTGSAPDPELVRSAHLAALEDEVLTHFHTADGQRLVLSLVRRAYHIGAGNEPEEDNDEQRGVVASREAGTEGSGTAGAGASQSDRRGERHLGAGLDRDGCPLHDTPALTERERTVASWIIRRIGEFADDVKPKHLGMTLQRDADALDGGED